MSKQGFIKLYRQVQNHWIYEEKRKFSKFEAWVDMLMLAGHKDNKFVLGNEIIELQRGQFVTSELKLMERWDWGKAKLRNFLEMLEKDEMIIKKSDRKKTTITICNYSVYHDYETESRPQADHKQTDSRPIADTIKNVKNVEEGKEQINNTTNPVKRIWDFWDQNGFGYNNLNAKEKLAQFLDEGMNEDVIIRALEIATENNKISYNYVSRILIDWDKRDLKTLEAVNAAEAEFKNAMKAKHQPRAGSFKKPVREEKTPEWFEDTQEYYKPKEDKPKEDAETKKLSIAEKLKAFNEGGKN